MERTVDTLIQEAIEQKVFPSAVYAVLLGGRVRAQGAWGRPDPEAEAEATPNTLYDLASLTKPLATTTLTLKAVEEGRLSLETPLARFFPEARALASITVRQLLTHTAGLPAWKPFYKHAQGREEVLKGVLSTPPMRQPGTGYTYSDLGYILMGALLEQVYEQSLAELFQRKVAEPLGMQSTTFNPPKEWQERIAPTSHSETQPDTVLRGTVHDENAQAMGGIAGHAGLFSTLEDLIRFMRMVMNGGRPLLSFYSVQLFLNPQVQLSNQPLSMHTLGLFAHPNPLLPRGDLFPTRCVGHSGFTGTLMLFDPQVELGVVFLSNHVYYSREKETYLDYRRRILNMLASQVGAV